MSDVEIFTDTERNYVLTVYADGTKELAQRDAYRRFLPPVTLHPEPVAELLAGADADAELLAEQGRV